MLSHVPTRAGMLLAALFLAATAWCASVPVTRSAMRRDGRAWVEDLRCDFPLARGAQLALQADRGQIEIKPVAADRVRCRVHLAAYIQSQRQARQCFDSYRLTATPTPDGVDLSGRFACKTAPEALAARFELSPPESASLDLRIGEGNITIRNLQGGLHAQTSAGDITTGNIGGPVFVSTGIGTIRLGDIGARARAESDGGGITVGNVNGGVFLETRGGDIVAGVINGPVRARTGAGTITLDAASGPVVAASEGGQIRLGQCGSTVRASTAGGNVQVAGAQGRVTAITAGGNISLLQAANSVMAETARGRILVRLDARRGMFGPSRLVAHGGGVDLVLPPTLPVTLRALMVDPARPIFSEFPLNLRTGGAESVPGSVHAVGLIAGGGPNVNIRVGRGGLQIRKIAPADAAQLAAFQQRFWRDWRSSERQRDDALRQFQQIQRQLERQRIVLQEQVQQLNRQLEDHMRQVEYVGP